MVTVKIPCAAYRMVIQHATKSLGQLYEKLMAGTRCGGYVLYDPGLVDDIKELDTVLSSVKNELSGHGAGCPHGPCTECPVDTRRACEYELMIWERRPDS